MKIDCLDVFQRFFNRIPFADIAPVAEILSDDCIYYSEGNNVRIFGKEEVVSQLSNIQIRRYDGIDVLQATVTSNNSKMDFPVGTSCLALKYWEIPAIKSLVFLTINSDGKVDQISVMDSSSFTFDIHYPEGWHGFTSRVVAQEVAYDAQGRIKETKRRYLDGTLVE